MDDHQWCPACADERAFVQPPCVDGHTDDGGECPDRACADCGTAIFIGEATVVPLHTQVRRAA
jgi:hypothetical protein